MRPLLNLTITLWLACLRLWAADVAPAVIAIQPFDNVRAECVETVRKGLAEAFGVKVEVLTNQALPKAAWYAPRGRYRAEKLLVHLNANTAAKYQIVVGITARDISTTKGEHEDWGIFGLGEVAGRACVVSTFRLGARNADEKRLRERLRKVAVHETGHVMGLDHCPTPGCVMSDGEGSIATVDGESGNFCEICKAVWESWVKDRVK